MSEQVKQALHDNSMNLSKAGGKSAAKAMRRGITEIERLESENEILTEGRCQSLSVIRQQKESIQQLTAERDAVQCDLVETRKSHGNLMRAIKKVLGYDHWPKYPVDGKSVQGHVADDLVNTITAERNALADQVRELEIIAESAWEYNRCQNPIAAQSCRGKLREVLADYKSKQQRELENALDAKEQP